MSTLFQLTANERKSVLGALLVIISILGVRMYDASQDALYVIPGQLEYDESDLAITDTIPNKVNQGESEGVRSRESKKVELVLQSKKINPNFATVKDWQQIGFSEPISERIFKYIKLKDGIDSPKDLLFVYGFKQNWLDQIEDSLYFEVNKIDIQFATEEEFQLLKGVGVVFAKRIVKYRNLLGGFHSIDQLLEVYGIDAVVFDELKSQVKCSIGTVKQLDVNTLSYNDLRKHPYISSDMALKIIERRSNRNIEELSELKSMILPTKFEKIKNYLKCKN